MENQRLESSNCAIGNWFGQGFSQQYGCNNEANQCTMDKSSAFLQKYEDSDMQYTESSFKKSKGKRRKGRKVQDFTLYQDQRILMHVLKFGPKFKKISRLLNGKPVNIIKNRYYRHLRYKWDEVLGEDFAYLNESKEKADVEQILRNNLLEPEYEKIITNMIVDIQTTITKCLNQIRNMD